MLFETLEIETCKGPNGEEVFPFDAEFKYWPPRRHGPMPNDTNAHFSIAWNKGTVERTGFSVKVPNARPGINRYQLVIRGNDMVTAEFGLSAPGVETLWAIQSV